MLQTTTVREYDTHVARNRAEIAAIGRWDRVVVLTNRAPLRHDRLAGGTVRVSRSSGGLVTAIEPVVKAHDGIWIAYGAGSADVCMNASKASPRDLGYRLRYVSISDADYRGYYYGFANEGLWPLCHNVGGHVSGGRFCGISGGQRAIRPNHPARDG